LINETEKVEGNVAYVGSEGKVGRVILCSQFYIQQTFRWTTTVDHPSYRI